MKRINVTKTFLPPIEEYEYYLKQIWNSGNLTNQGPLLLELETKLKKYLNVNYFHFVSNGTIALQLALKALDINEGEIITTPFSYVATSSAILWERCDPVFVDIDPVSFCIDPDKIEAAITPRTRAILPVHVFGNACDVEKIDTIAKKHNLKVIYDAAHSFGATYKGESLLSFGDISTGSFHATKLFHTIEGGCIVAKDENVSKKIELLKHFGHSGDDHYMLGINAKATEFQAAMGLCNIEHIDEIIEKRKSVFIKYDEYLKSSYLRPVKIDNETYNYSYYPLLFDNEDILASKLKELNNVNIYPRRYFYPSLNNMSYIKNKQHCPISENISRRIVCLPLYPDLEEAYIQKICEIINK